MSDDIEFEEYKQHFLDNGYFVIKNGVEEEHCQNVIKIAEEVLRNDYGDDYSNHYRHIKLVYYNDKLSTISKQTLHNSVCGKTTHRVNNILTNLGRPEGVHDVNSACSIWSFPSNDFDNTILPVAWHIDGWEHHSLTQNLHITAVRAYTDTPDGTFVAPESIKLLTEFLFKQKKQFSCEQFLEFGLITRYIINQCSDIRQIKCNKGDIVVMHPFLFHGANFASHGDEHRVVTNYHIYKPIDIANPVTPTELLTKKHLDELGLDIKDYTVSSKINCEYPPIITRKGGKAEDLVYYNAIVKPELKYLQSIGVVVNENDKKSILCIDGEHHPYYWRNDYTDDNEKEIDDQNMNVYLIIRANFGNIFPLK